MSWNGSPSTTDSRGRKAPFFMPCAFAGGMPYYVHQPETAQHLKTMTNLNPTRTAAEKAAFKAANLAAKPQTVQLWPVAKAQKPSHRQQWSDFRAETLSMIQDAKRQRHFHLLPQLMQRLQNANTILATIS